MANWLILLLRAQESHMGPSSCSSCFTSNPVLCLRPEKAVQEGPKTWDLAPVGETPKNLLPLDQFGSSHCRHLESILVDADISLSASLCESTFSIKINIEEEGEGGGRGRRGGGGKAEKPLPGKLQTISETWCCCFMWYWRLDFKKLDVPKKMRGNNRIIYYLWCQHLASEGTPFWIPGALLLQKGRAECSPSRRDAT